mgnify:CR=1 FL=1
MRALGALVMFPHQKAAEEVIETIHYSWAGFGRGYMYQGTQRAFIADYELVSGGTGFSIVEVADPVVRNMQTGVVLDVDVKRVEGRLRRKVLEGMGASRQINWENSRLAVMTTGKTTISALMMPRILVPVSSIWRK